MESDGDSYDSPREPYAWHAQAIEEIYEELETSRTGLTDTEAAQRLIRYGANELKKKSSQSILRMLWEQIKDPMILILIAAAVLSFVLDQRLEGAVILIIVVINATISIIQEKKAESSIEALKQMSAGRTIALREGEESDIPARDLVLGDIVFLESGDMVPADIRLIDSANLKIEEASLTGESVSVEKDDGALPANCALGDRTNMAYSSTFVTYGRAVGVVVATGMSTQVGQIAEMLEEQDDFDTPLKRKLASVGKTLTIVGLIICVVIFAVGFIYKQPLIPLLMTAISLAIAVIPEGLPATATIVLALGVQRMAKRGAIIRKLPAAETLGGATIICSDKTGTLTLNKMTVTQLAITSDIYGDRSRPVAEALLLHEDYEDLILIGSLCNNAEFDPDNHGSILGDPTEGALIELARKFGEDHNRLEDENPRLFEQPFDSIRKRMSTINKMNGGLRVFTKGAVEEVLPVCTDILTSEGTRSITIEDVDRTIALSEKMAAQALRVLAFAQKSTSKVPDESNADVEFELTFVGLVGMIDPPREEVKAAIKTCYDAGIRTAMVTGDHKVTAIAIAQELGIWQEGGNVLTGTELDKMSDVDYDNTTAATSVYARVTPEQKLKIVQSLNRVGEVTAMTGDGVNDAPALKAADIGIAMGISGTDVAKEASDMVITDDNFATIVDATKEGRRVYRNIQKVIQQLLAGNTSEVLTILVATIFDFPAPLLAVHILWVNLASPALALGVDPPEADVMKRRPIKSNSLFEKGLVGRVLIQGSFIAIATLIAFFIGYQDDVASGQAMAFCVIAFSQLLNSLNQRSDTESIFSKGFFGNRYLLGAIVTLASLMLILVTVPTLREAFELSFLDRSEWFMILVLSLMPTVLVEILKAIQRTIHRCTVTRENQ